MLLPLGVEDISGFGLGADIVGAVVLARSLRQPLVTIANSGTFDGMRGQFESVNDRVDGDLGIALLVSGFGAQIVGYLLLAAGVDSADPSIWRVLTFVASTLLGVVVTWFFYARARPFLLMRVAARSLESDPHARPAEARAEMVLKLGHDLGFEPLPGETVGRYAQRVFGLRFVTRADESVEALRRV